MGTGWWPCLTEPDPADEGRDKVAVWHTTSLGLMAEEGGSVVLLAHWCIFQAVWCRHSPCPKPWLMHPALLSSPGETLVYDIFPGISTRWSQLKASACSFALYPCWGQLAQMAKARNPRSKVVLEEPGGVGDLPGSASELSCSSSGAKLAGWQPYSSALCAGCEMFTNFPWLRIFATKCSKQAQ